MAELVIMQDEAGWACVGAVEWGRAKSTVHVSRDACACERDKCMASRTKWLLESRVIILYCRRKSKVVIAGDKGAHTLSERANT